MSYRFCTLLMAALVLCTNGCGPDEGIDLLLVAPFSQGLAPSTDDPDTLRRGLRDELKTLRMLPRNVADPRELRGALEEADCDVVWIRSDSNLDAWARAIPETWAGLLILSRPPLRLSPLEAFEPTLPGPVLLTHLARSDHQHIDHARLLLHALGGGATLDDALRQAFDNGPRWTLIGDGSWKVSRR